ncbi:lipid-A-disaccharide synthase N-terminal domain-containing protein [Tistrella bauzanensis]|uniref:Lipid-A-disaccharide synthase N-terminal domain-containing protein n=1 Tax=Tistrella arctica TaxID=3133430 RepID=A0ABU9YMS8_9PROT
MSLILTIMDALNPGPGWMPDLWGIDLWLVVGFAGQSLFSARFMVQWLASERRRHSYIPVVFWYLSLGGGALLFVYAIKRGDPVFIAGQGVGLVVYLRNLVLIRKSRQPAAADRRMTAA